jgi:hypothetical protein
VRPNVELAELDAVLSAQRRLPTEIDVRVRRVVRVPIGIGNGQRCRRLVQIDIDGPRPPMDAEPQAVAPAPEAQFVADVDVVRSALADRRAAARRRFVDPRMRKPEYSRTWMGPEERREAALCIVARLGYGRRRLHTWHTEIIVKGGRE